VSESGTLRLRRLPLWLELLLLAVLVVAGAGVRIDYAMRCRWFDRTSSDGILTTDPALIAYITDRIVEAGGGPPSDFRADPRPEFPETSDMPAMETVGQEFVVAWAKLLVGDDVALHVVAVWVMSLFAASIAIGAWGIARELTGSGPWALAAALVWSVLISSYRTLAFVFIREDFSLPFYAAHLWFAVRAAQRRDTLSLLLAGTMAGLAAATWHAIGSFLLLEIGCLVAWFVRSGQNPFAQARAALLLLPPLVLGVCAPVLRVKGFVWSLPIVLALALVIAGVVQRRGSGRALQTTAFAGSAVLLGMASGLLSRVTGSGLYDYSHVFELLWAKIRWLGLRPADPNALSFGARLLWQGPFETADLSVFLLRIGLALIPLAVAVGFGARAWWTGRGDGRIAALAALGVAACLVSWLIERTYVLAGVLASAATAMVLARVRVRWLAVALLAVVVGWQGWLLGSRVLAHPMPWWARPDPVQIPERADLVAFVRAHVPPGEAIAADFVTSSGLLYHTRHPSLIQPKYETVRSRERIEAFFDSFYHNSVAGFRAWLVSNRCRWFVLDRHWVWGNRWIAGLPWDQKGLPFSQAAAWFLSDRYRDVPGFELVYTSPARYRLDTFRVYRLRER
jgi:hypothetical protein